MSAETQMSDAQSTERPASTPRASVWAPENWHHFDAFIGLMVAAMLGALIAVAGQKGIGEWVDGENYEMMFTSLIGESWSDALTIRADPLYSLLSKLAQALGLSFAGFVFVVATITIAIKQKALRAATPDAVALFALYMSYVFWLHEYTQIRVAMALAFAMYGIYVAKSTRIVWFVAGVLIHASVGLVAAGYYGLRHPRLGVAAAALAVLVFVVAVQYFSFDPFSIERIGVYASLVDRDIFSEINLLATMPILQGCILLCCLGLAEPLKSTGRMEFIFSCVGLASFYAFSFLPPIAFRFYELFLPFFLILLARVWKRTPALIFLTALYFLSGLKTTFVGTGSLLFPNGG